MTHNAIQGLCESYLNKQYEPVRVLFNNVVF